MSFISREGAVTRGDLGVTIRCSWEEEIVLLVKKTLSEIISIALFHINNCFFFFSSG